MAEKTKIKGPQRTPPGKSLGAEEVTLPEVKSFPDPLKFNKDK